MSTQETFLLSILSGQILPVLTDGINKHIGSSRVRWWVSVFVSVAIGVFFNWGLFHFHTFQDVGGSILLLWFSGQAAYKTYYEGSQLQYKIRNLIIPQ